MAGPFTPRSAKNAQVRANNAVFVSKKWNVDPKIDKIDTTNMESAGFATSICGILQAEFTIEYDLDANNNPYDFPLSPGPGVGILFLYLNTVALGVGWKFTTWNIFETPMSADVRQSLSGSFKGEGTGVFLYPTGVF